MTRSPFSRAAVRPHAVKEPRAHAPYGAIRSTCHTRHPPAPNERSNDLVSSQYLITKPPNPELCPHCERLLLVGVAEGISYRADAEPINHTGEVAAILDKLNTWQLVAGELVYRNPQRIRANPAGTVPVFTTHHCDRSIPTKHCASIQIPTVEPPCRCPPNQGHTCPPPF